DLMPRNLDRRVEILFPVENAQIRNAIVSIILPVQLKDPIKVRLLKSNGLYERRRPSEDMPILNAQTWLVDHRGIWYNDVH
ncbi:MAG: RNA degradosome polyphosphate kinase, partial [Candidatus Atribacteria bacterium]